ncbi:MAG: S-formylglutathione hydrolase [candidate division BRC1 bacterium ADurb.BinA364]|nr:MAG: S-formylglutathione hydrolase [candidate division BRC1 bacterium ADurb.BinA364]
MALFQCSFFSDALGMSASMNVILPQPARGQIGIASAAANGKHPTLYLLHGLSDDHTIWLRRTSIERYAAPLGLAVVMPCTHRGFYTDMARGYKYWQHVAEEVPALCRSFFPLSEAREDTFVAGLSMGGYGAFKMALRLPERFAAAASLSGALDMARTAKEAEPARRAEWENVFGDLGALAGGDNDLFALADRLAPSGKPRPKLFQCCGTEDFLIESNHRFRDRARELGFDLEYHEEPGAHEWGFWDNWIQRVLEWLPLKKKAE